MQKQPYLMINDTRVTGESRLGKIRYGVAAWLLGLPLPIIIIALFIRGCDW